MLRGNKRLFALGRKKTGEMNKTEAAYAAHLMEMQHSGAVQWHVFEGVKLRLADNTFYTPDFCVMTDGNMLEMHEVKGAKAIFMDDAKVKIKVAAEMYPFRFVAAYPKPKKDGGGWELQEF